MGILSTAAANSAKRAIEVALPDRAAITRVTRTQDPVTGGYTETEATYASGIPCRVDRSGLTPREREIADRFGSVQTVNIMLSALPTRWPGSVVDVRAADALVVTGDGAGRYEAAEDGGPTTDEFARTVICVKIS